MLLTQRSLRVRFIAMPRIWERTSFSLATKTSRICAKSATSLKKFYLNAGGTHVVVYSSGDELDPSAAS